MKKIQKKLDLERKSQGKKMPDWLYKFNSIPCIIRIASLIGFLLLIIGFFCPLGGYNPTVFDETEIIIDFFDFSFSSQFFIGTTLIISVALYIIGNEILIHKIQVGGNYKSESNICVAFSIINFVLGMVLIVGLFWGLSSYKIPNEDVFFIEIYEKFGFFLIIIGYFIENLLNMLYYFLIHQVAYGKIPIERLYVNRVENVNEKMVQIDQDLTNNSINSLTSKLKEIQQLKDNGLITEEDYISKKEDLLKSYK